MKVAYLVMTGVLEKLKEIIKLINIVEIDLLDISSLINYEIIQVDKMVIDIKEQLESHLESIPLRFDEVKDTLEDESSAIKDFIKQRIEET